MIKNIINTPIVALLILATTVSCSKSVYTTKSEDPVNLESQSLLDSLSKISLVEWDLSPLMPQSTVLEGSDIDSPHYEFMHFSSTQSSKILLEEHKSVLMEDLELRYVDLKRNFHFPLDTGYVTSPYGWRRNRMHAGVDIKAHKGDNIYAVFDGVVRMSKYYSAFGYCVLIHHYNGLETLYAHASKLLVKVNDEVKSGDLIALAGRTGRASGDHLHFEVRVNGQYIDPSLLLDVENLTIQKRNIYATMRSGRIFASNEDSMEVREEQIREQLAKKYHTVRSGDTLSRIAVNNSTTVTALCRLNNISSRSTLRIGQRVRVR